MLFVSPCFLEFDIKTKRNARTEHAGARMAILSSNFLRRHYPDQVQGDLELQFVPISAEEALSAPVFMSVGMIAQEE